jgi:hypothetical protein
MLREQPQAAVQPPLRRARPRRARSGNARPQPWCDRRSWRAHESIQQDHPPRSYRGSSRKPTSFGSGMKAFDLDPKHDSRYTNTRPFGDRSLETGGWRLPGESPSRRKTSQGTTSDRGARTKSRILSGRRDRRETGSPDPYRGAHGNGAISGWPNARGDRIRPSTDGNDR